MTRLRIENLDDGWIPELEDIPPIDICGTLQRTFGPLKEACIYANEQSLKGERETEKEIKKLYI